jgi:hypothetical protein
LSSVLSSKDFELFKLFIWVRTNSCTPFQVNADVSFDRFTFLEKLRDKRSQVIREKTTRIDAILSGNKPLDHYYHRCSIPFEVTALGLGQKFPSNQFELHPIVWAINQQGNDLTDILVKIWDDESTDLMFPVEYLPIISTRDFFQRRMSRGEYLSKLIIDTFHELKDQS